MLLSDEDIRRIEEIGHRRDLFVLFDRKGYAKLKNAKGHCVFFNLESKRCIIYRWRPLGCRLYPVIFDEEKWIVLDPLCTATERLTEKQIAQNGSKVLRLLEKIDAQAESRHDLLRQDRRAQRG